VAQLMSLSGGTQIEYEIALDVGYASPHGQGTLELSSQYLNILARGRVGLEITLARRPVTWWE
jgi:hypothetical protein